MPLKEYDDIRLRSEFEGTLGDKAAIDSHPNRTPGKDEVAQYILDEVVREGRWPVQMTELAEETGYSRQHCSNVIAHYFQGIDDNGTGGGDPSQHKSPMSATPNDSLSGEAQPDSATTEETKSVFVEIGGHMQEVTIDIPSDLSDPRSSYVRGYLDGKRD